MLLELCQFSRDTAQSHCNGVYSFFISLNDYNILL
jgi:hypothetical protein